MDSSLATCSMLASNHGPCPFWMGPTQCSATRPLSNGCLHIEHDGPRLVRRLYSRALQQGFVVGRVVQAHWKLKACLQQSPSSSLPSSQIDVLISTFVCRRCASKFGTLHQLQVHLWLAHEEISEERSMMTSTTCNACNVCFWSSQRLQQHLRHSRRHVNGCYEKLTWRSAPSLTAPDIDEMPRQERFHRQPAMRVASVTIFMRSSALF